MRSNPYLDEIIDFGGEWMPRGRVIATMQREGHDQRCIDRWLQGQELGAEIRRRHAEEELKAASVAIVRIAKKAKSKQSMKAE